MLAGKGFTERKVFSSALKAGIQEVGSDGHDRRVEFPGVLLSSSFTLLQVCYFYMRVLSSGVGGNRRESEKEEYIFIKRFGSKRFLCMS